MATEKEKNGIRPQIRFMEQEITEEEMQMTIIIYYFFNDLELFCLLN